MYKQTQIPLNVSFFCLRLSLPSIICTYFCLLKDVALFPLSQSLYPCRSHCILVAVTVSLSQSLIPCRSHRILVAVTASLSQSPYPCRSHCILVFLSIPVSVFAYVMSLSLFLLRPLSLPLSLSLQQPMCPWFVRSLKKVSTPHRGLYFTKITPQGPAPGIAS